MHSSSRCRTALGSVALTLASLLLCADAQGRRPITETDLLKFVWVADPQISPDGSRVAFVRSVVNEKQDGYESSIWSAPLDRHTTTAGPAGLQRLTTGEHDTAPRWSPDGEWLAFLRATDREGKTQPPQIFLLSTRAGEAQALTDLPRGRHRPRVVARRAHSGIYVHGEPRRSPTAA